MAISKVETRGRPFYVANLPGGIGTKQQILDDFASVMRAINYREITALARTLNLNRGTVSNWKYCNNTPRLDIALDIIKWHHAGKPVSLVYQRDKARHGLGPMM